MKKIVFIFISIVLLWVTGAKAQGQVGATVVVRADGGWVDTGIDVAAGEPLTIRSAGKWSNAPGPDMTGADGWGPYPGTEVADANIGALIGRIGDMKFQVGGYRQLRPQKSGRLWLAINDLSGSSADNQGALQSMILYVPRQPEEAKTIDVAVRTQVGAEPDIPVGEKVAFVFEIQNVGTATISSVAVRGAADNLDDVSVRRACSELPCELHDLAPGERRELLVGGTTRQAGRYRFRLNATAVSDIDRTNDEVWIDAITRESMPSADVSIEAAPSPVRSISEGDTIAVAFIVHNKGPQIATQIAIDGATSNLKATSFTGECNDIPCVIPSLSPAGSVRFTAHGRASGGDVRIDLRVVSSSVADPNGSNNAIHLVRQLQPPGESPSGFNATAQVLDDRLKQGGTLRFQIELWNRGTSAVRNVVVKQGNTWNLGLLLFADPCDRSGCMISTLAPDQKFIIVGEFKLPRAGDISADFPVTWVTGTGETRRTFAGFAGRVGGDGRLWLWVVAAVVVGGLGYTIFRKPIPRPDPDDVPSPELQPDNMWGPRVRVDPVPATAGDALPLTDIPLSAPPLRLQVALVLDDAVVCGDLPAWKKEI